MSRLRDEGPALAVLGLMLALGLFLRVHSNDYGLPYVYYVDEGSHFTKRAVEMFRDANPGYFQNPSAYTYLLHLTYRFAGGHGIPFGGGDVIINGYRSNAPWIFEISRALAAVLSLVGVAAVYYVGSRLWDRRVGLVAAAVLCFAFLPVTFSRIAVTDVGTLAPVAFTYFFTVRAHERGGLRWWAAAGLAAGLAIGFKYTAGLVLLIPLLAAALPLARRRDRETLRAAGLAGLAVLGAAIVAFALTNPYFFLDFADAKRQLQGQAQLAGNQKKFGQEGEHGVLYYAGSLLWGLGWAATAAALAGIVLLVRRDRFRAALMLVFPVALFLYLSVQSRYFGRWLLPVYPLLALLAGLAVVRAVELLRARAPRLGLPALAAGVLVLVWQPLAADARSMAVLGQTDTREIARDWLVAHSKPELRIVIEPAVPNRYYFLVRGGRPRHLPRQQFVNQIIVDVRATHTEYGRTLRPELLDAYRRQGYCTVMTMDLIRGRAENAKDASALAYYARLERESTLVYSVSPYRADHVPPRFSFDLSYDYYSPAYERPGPAIRIYRLDRCRQGYGPTRAGSEAPSEGSQE